MYKSLLVKNINFGGTMRITRRTPQWVHNIRNVTETRAFKDLKTDIDKTQYLYRYSKENETEYTPKNLMDYLGVKKTAFYTMVGTNSQEIYGYVKDTSQTSGKSYLSDDDLQLVRAAIAGSIRVNKTMSVKEFRKFLEEFISAKYHKTVTLNKNYVSELIKRDPQLCTRRIKSLESPRCNVSQEAVDEYISAINEMIANNPCPSLVINMDETGLSARIDKDTTRNCVVLADSPEDCFFEEKSDYKSMSVCVGISLDGEHLKPLIITDRKRIDQSMERDKYIWNAEYTFTPRGFMNSDAMIVWIARCLAPYVFEQRTQIGDRNAVVYLLMDNMSAHDTEDVMNAFRLLDPVKIIKLPPHSSHLLQPLDAIYFGVFKQYYRRYKTETDHQNFHTKCTAIIRSLYHANDSKTIIKSWEKAGIFINDDGSENQTVSFDISKHKAQLLHEETT